MVLDPGCILETTGDLKNIYTYVKAQLQSSYIRVSLDGGSLLTVLESSLGDFNGQPELKSIVIVL